MVPSCFPNFVRYPTFFENLSNTLMLLGLFSLFLFYFACTLLLLSLPSLFINGYISFLFLFFFFSVLLLLLLHPFPLLLLLLFFLCSSSIVGSPFPSLS